MNKMKKMALLLLIAAASNSATAQNEVIRLQAGVAFTLHSKAEAVGTGLPPKYQWYRDGSPIEGATSPGYTIPAGQTVGSNVEFKRAAYTEGCAERMFTNTITITWCNLLLNGVCWADVNVAQPGIFAPRPDMHTEFYQWNQPNKAWSPTDPAAGIAVNGWPLTITAPAWASTPCPEGWRLPTRTEYQALHNQGSTWVSANDAARGNAAAGRFYGLNHNNAVECKLPSPMNKCVFIPASGLRDGSNGSLRNQSADGLYWSSTQANAGSGYILLFNTSTSNPSASYGKGYGFSVRCVQ